MVDGIVIPYKFPRDPLQEEAPWLPPIPAYLEPYVPRHPPQEFIPQELTAQELDEFAQEIGLGQKVEPEPIGVPLWEGLSEPLVEMQAAFARREETKPRLTRQQIQEDRAMRASPTWGTAKGPKWKEPPHWLFEYRLWEIEEAKKAWKQAQHVQVP